MFDSSLELELQWEGLAGSNLLGLCKEKLWVSQNEVPESVDREGNAEAGMVRGGCT